MKCQVDPEAADPRFCVYWLRSPKMRAHVKRTMKGTNPNIQKINQRNILAFAFPAAVAIGEQRSLVVHLDSVQQKVDSLRQLQSETAAEVRMLLPGILAAAFNGQA
jgi:restriction endonuclease S subunit